MRGGRAWLLGGSYWGRREDRLELGRKLLAAFLVERRLVDEQARDPCVGDRLRRRARLAEDAVREAARAVLTAGLEARAGAGPDPDYSVDEQNAGAFGGVLALTAGERRTCRALVKLVGVARHPAGVADCEMCGVVFRPTRKGHASKCSRCHRSPRPPTPAPRGRSPEAIAAARAEGWEPYRATVARETFDEAGNRAGWRSVTVARCEGCDGWMEGRRHARTCSTTCRSRAHRRSPAGAPGSDANQEVA